MYNQKSFSELVKEATMDEDQLREKIIDEDILPRVIAKLGHRMNVLTHYYKFNDARALFTRALNEAVCWFTKDQLANKGYKLSYDTIDQHGRVTLTFSLAFNNVKRIYNLSAVIDKERIFKATNDSLFQ